ncbi:MAG TPA: ATP-binding protein [Spirochaetia bacterium]|nr:ATP-binding protein [Spirochaetia bacterium]
MRMSLRFRFSISFTMLAMLVILAFGILINFVLERQFRNYTVQKIERKNRELASFIAGQHGPDNAWNVEAIRAVGVSALDDGILLRITDREGRTVWDALEYDSGLCSLMKENISRLMESRYPGVNGGYALTDFPIQSDSGPVGALQASYYKPFYFTDSELFFIDTINRSLLWIALGALVVSVTLGFLISNHITAPLSLLSHSARRIARGDYSAGQPVKVPQSEISDLAVSLAHLSRTLEAQESLRRRLTADVAHELRTPRATLQSHLEAMIDGVWEPDREKLTGCHEEIERLTRLISDLETLARCESENMKLEKSRFDLTEVVRQCILIFDNDSHRKDLTVSCNSSPVQVHGDRDKLTQVCVNLLSNAVKFTPGGGSVRFGVDTRPGGVQFSIADTGVGIPEEHLDFIFERFYRVDSSRNRLTGGSGIGLTIAREIVRAHGGDIEVKSRVGIGSEFLIYLPQD